jgi:hypothetical protein
LDNKNEVSEKMMAKNPYDSKSLLKDSEREYLKQILFEIQKYQLNLKKEDIKNIDISTLESIEQTDKTGKLTKAIITGEYFKIPLVRSDQIDKYGKVMFGGIQGITKSIKDNLGEFNDLLNPRELVKDDLQIAREQQFGLHEMYDVYGNQTDAAKLEAIKRHRSMDY